jgi:hypothetical protein
MKKLLIIMLLPTVLFAQKKNEVYKKLANLTCECSSKKTDKSELSLGLCIFESLDKINPKEQKVIGYNLDKKIETAEKVAENVGVEMALVCPEVISGLSGSEEEVAEEPVVDSTYITFTGVFEEIKSSEFNTIVMSNDAKEKKEFIWLFPFDNDALFVKGKISKGDKIELEYREQSFFDPKKKEYRTYNEITGVKFIN